MRRPLALLLLLAGTYLPAACSAPSADPAPVVAAVPHKTVAPTPVPVDPTNTAVPAPEPPTSTPAPPPTIALDTKEIQKELVKIEADTTKMRGLKPKKPVPAHFISPDQMKYSLTQQTLKGYTQEMATRDATRLWLSLLIDNRDTDFRQMESDFAGQAVLGYYDNQEKQLYVRMDGTSTTLSPGAKETLAHEYVHSLQDQYYNLQTLRSKEGDSDRSLAVTALIEGDATVSGLLYASQYMTRREFDQSFQDNGEMGQPVPGRQPVYLEQSWQFPYTYGAHFVFSLGTLGDYRPVNAAFKNPPRSTEQIMHPQKYLSKTPDEPINVELPALTSTLGQGWKATETDTVGEFELSLMLKELYVEDPNATAGWGGGKYTLYENGKDALIIMGTRWDTKRDLQEWEDALQQGFNLFSKNQGYWTDRGRIWGEARSGETVMFVSGTDLAAVQHVMATFK